jgi:hypothetical protein
MAIVDDKTNQAHMLVGTRVEIPVHYDNWMRGARYGRVVSKARDGSFVRVKLDHPAIKRLQKVWAIDFDYLKHIDA